MQFGTMNLFPLIKLNARYEGYFLSKEGAVYSTKRSSKPSDAPYKMTGSGYGYLKYYTLNKVSVDGNSLLRLAKAHKDFNVDTSAPVAGVAPKVVTVAGTKRSHATALDQGIKGRGFVIAQVAVHDGQEHLLFGSKPAIHMTEASYRDEMTRLAAQKPGTKFVALKIVASVVSGGVQWE